VGVVVIVVVAAAGLLALGLVYRKKPGSKS
jgi:hypothetical protein